MPIKELFKLACLIIVSIAISLGIVLYNIHNNEIHSWAKLNGYQVQSIERGVTYKPFAELKNDEVVRAVLVDTKGNRRVAFFRWLDLQMEQGWETD